jgi:hypothetical protein
MWLSMSKRIQVVLPDYLYEVLEKKSVKEGRSISNLSAFLIESVLRAEIEQKTSEKKSKEPT